MTVNLFYSWNTAVETIGVVFVFTEILDRSTEPSEYFPYTEDKMPAKDRAELAKKLFEMLGIKDTVIHTDLSKAQVIEKLNELQKKADSFRAKEGQVLGIFMYVIGYSLSHHASEVRGLMETRDYEREEDHPEGEKFTLTTTGEVLTLSEYCYRLSINLSVHVVLLIDSNETEDIDEEEYIHPSARGKEGWNELNLQDRSGVSRVHFFDYCNTDDTYKFVLRAQQTLGQKSFIFPHFLKVHTHQDTLEGVGEHEEMLIDLRDEKDMSDLRKNISRNSLSSELTVIK